MAAEGDNMDPSIHSPGTAADHGHAFKRKTFKTPSVCHHCTETLFTPFSSGFVCEICNFTCHERCQKTVASFCSGIAMQLVKNPVAHTWSLPSDELKSSRICCVCRKRCEGITSVECEICDYYVHTDCLDMAVSDCKEAATFSGNLDPKDKDRPQRQHHHWREGNLPSSSKCVMCRKPCYSNDCLAGMRCEWCMQTAHAICYRDVPEECDFGVLKPIILPPNCLTIPRTELPMSELLGIRPKHAKNKDSSPGPFAHNVHGDDTESGSSKENKDTKEKDDYEVLRVYDGNTTFKNNQHRLIRVPLTASVQQIRDAALRVYHIAVHDPTKIYITQIMNEDGSEEEELVDDRPLRNLARPDGQRGRIFVRMREVDNETSILRVYGCWLRLRLPITYCTLTATNTSTAREIIADACRQFNLTSNVPNDFNLVEVSLEKGVAECILPEDQPIIPMYQNSRREGLRRYNLMRFYLQRKLDPHGSDVTVFVANLPAKLFQSQYEKMIMRMLDATEKPFHSSSVISDEHGSVVLTFDDARLASSAVLLLNNATYTDERDNIVKTLTVMCLPNIQTEAIADDVEPLMVFVNTKSGGCMGERLLRVFRKLLNPFQVFDVLKGSPLVGLYVFRNVKKYKIMACGGDGTVGWVLNCLDMLRGQQWKFRFIPPCAILPLGTGNDLSRVLRWGNGYHSRPEENVIVDTLKDIIEAEEVQLDRWTVSMTGRDIMAGMCITEEKTSIITMNNYFGIGIEAEVALQFNDKRNKHPEQFNSQFSNKQQFLEIGLRNLMTKKYTDFPKWTRLTVDGRLVELGDCEGIIILNIQSWGSGVNPWGTNSDDRFTEQSHHDGKLEVLSISGMSHLGLIQSRASSGKRLAQGKSIKIETSEILPVQVDGEAQNQPPGTIHIINSACKAKMLKKTKKMSKQGKVSMQQPVTTSPVAAIHEAVESAPSTSTTITLSPPGSDTMARGADDSMDAGWFGDEAHPGDTFL